MRVHFSEQIRMLWIYLAGAAAAWIVVGLSLHRNGFTYNGSNNFDWPGLIFMVLSLFLTVVVFKLLKDRQKHLRYHYAIYGIIWLMPLIVVSAMFQHTPIMTSSSKQAGTFSSVENSCPPRLLPRTCTYYEAQYNAQSGTTKFEPRDEHVFQSGYAALIVLYAVVGFNLYRYIKRRIKHYRHEELFQ